MMKVFSIEYALLAMQSALLGVVTGELRAVLIDLDEDEQIFYAHFYYDGEASEKMIDLWQCAITEASASLGPDCFVKFGVERLDFPKKIPLHSYYAYLRKEGASSKEEIGYEVKITELSIGYALLAVQNALLGIVTPELRAVIVDFDKETSLLYIRFYYDGEVSEELINLWQNAIVDSNADFGAKCLLDAEVERLDYPKNIPFRGSYAYLRKN